MEWFKHSTSSHDDPDISDAMDRFGHAGYSVFFMTLEVYGDEFNHLDSEGWLKLSKRFVARKLRNSSGKVEQILNFYSERQRIIVKTEGDYILINCPKFIDIASNWTKREKPKPEITSVGTSVVPTAKEEEVEEEKKKNKKKIKKAGRDFVFVLPEEIDQKVWDAFVEMRKYIKKPLTEYAKHLICLDLGKLDGDKNEILNQSIKKSWQGVFPLDDTRKTTSPTDALSDLNRYLEEGK